MMNGTTNERERALEILAGLQAGLERNQGGQVKFTRRQAAAVLELAQCAIESSHIDARYGAGSYKTLTGEFVAAFAMARRIDWNRVIGFGGVGAFCAAVWFVIRYLFRKG